VPQAVKGSEFPRQNAGESEIWCRVLGAFGSNVSDLGMLGSQVHRQGMGSFVERSIHIIAGVVIDDQVQQVSSRQFSVCNKGYAHYILRYVREVGFP
jgi:hypothetical protein